MPGLLFRAAEIHGRRDDSEQPIRPKVRLDGLERAADRTTTVEQLATALGLHAGSKPVGTYATGAAWLIGALHDSTPKRGHTRVRGRGSKHTPPCLSNAPGALWAFCGADRVGSTLDHGTHGPAMQVFEFTRHYWLEGPVVQNRRS